eukprot:scaffold5839_cov49-Attheya_sp.AAC.2
MDSKSKQEEERDFKMFYRELKKDMAAEGEEVDEEEAREMFESFVHQDIDSLEKEVNSEGAFDEDLLAAIPDTFEEYYETMKDEFDAEGMEEAQAREFYTMMKDQFSQGSKKFLASENNDSSASDKKRMRLDESASASLSKEETFEEMYSEMKKEMGADIIDKAQAREFYDMMEDQSLKGVDASMDEIANSPAFKDLNGNNKPYDVTAPETNEVDDDVSATQDVVTSDDADTSDDVDDTSDDEKVELPDTFEIFYQEMKGEFDADGMSEQDAKEMYDMLSVLTLRICMWTSLGTMQSCVSTKYVRFAGWEGVVLCSIHPCLVHRHFQETS